MKKYRIIEETQGSNKHFFIEEESEDGEYWRRISGEFGNDPYFFQVSRVYFFDHTAKAVLYELENSQLPVIRKVVS